MKRLVLFILFFQIVKCGYTQVDLEKLLNQKKALPSDWVNILTIQSKWNIIDGIFIGDRSRKFYLHDEPWWLGDSQTHIYQFTTLNVSKFPFIIDSINTLPVVYFPGEGTFYTSYTIMLDGKPFILKHPYQVFYLDSETLALEHLDKNHFDYNSGKILSGEELQRRRSETQKQMKNQPGNYDVTDKSKKRSKNAKEGLRIIEFLSIKN